MAAMLQRFWDENVKIAPTEERKLMLLGGLETMIISAVRTCIAEAPELTLDDCKCS